MSKTPPRGRRSAPTGGGRNAPPSNACPTCKGEVAPREENRSFPFCSERCRLIDLGRWLDEDYRIPGPPGTPPERKDD